MLTILIVYANELFYIKYDLNCFKPGPVLPILLKIYIALLHQGFTKAY